MSTFQVVKVLVRYSKTPFRLCPQLNGCIWFAPPRHTSHILHNDLLCDGTFSVTGNWGGGGGVESRKRFFQNLSIQFGVKEEQWLYFEGEKKFWLGIKDEGNNQQFVTFREVECRYRIYFPLNAIRETKNYEVQNIGCIESSCPVVWILGLASKLKSVYRRPKFLKICSCKLVLPFNS